MHRHNTTSAQSTDNPTPQARAGQSAHPAPAHVVPPLCTCLFRSGFSDFRNYLGSMFGGGDSNGLPPNTPKVVLAAPAQPVQQVQLGRVERAFNNAADQPNSRSRTPMSE